MAIDVTILGNQIKVEGAPVFDGKSVYDNISQIKPEYNGNNVSLINTVTNSLFLPPVDFNEFNTPDGTAAGSAEALVDAIALLLPAPAGGGGPANVEIVDGATAGSQTTETISVSSTELLPVNANRTSAVMTNYGSVRVHLAIGGFATLTSAEFIDPGEIWITNKTLAIEAIAPSGSNLVSITEYTK